MAKRKRKVKKTTRNRKIQYLDIINPNAAGIDIGSEWHFVAVPPNRDKKTVRSFQSFTEDLSQLADWLEECDVDSVAMESTGVYWIPLFQILEKRGFEVKLVNARYVKNVPGRKTDVEDCQWLQQLNTYGLLHGSFRPSDDVCVLRSYTRQRDTLTKITSSIISRMQKAMAQMNIQLHNVISDITGVTGMRIIGAILEGARDPLKLANMKDPRIKSSHSTIAKSLRGDWREEHLFALQLNYDLYNYHVEKIKECDLMIENALSQFESKVDEEKWSTLTQRKRSTHKYPLSSSIHQYLYRMTGVDFTTVDGFNTQTVLALVAECGIDHRKWKTEKHYASWLGLCPANQITGGKVKKRSTRKVINRAANALRISAQTLFHSNSALGAYARRMRMRLGAPQAITATAHKLARIYYRMLKYGKNYVDAGIEYYENKHKERVINNLKKRALQLGYEIVETQQLTEVVS